MNRTDAEKLLQEAQKANNGLWISHSRHVARLAEQIADKAGTDAEQAYVFGLLHDIGHRNGAMQARL